MSYFGKHIGGVFGKWFGAITAKVEEGSGGILKVARDRLRILQESERLAKQRKKEQELERESAEELARIERIEAERLAEEEAERQYADLVARLSVVAPEELANPVELAPDAIDRLETIATKQEIYTDRTAPVQKTAKSIQVIDDDEALALIMILAEID